jgi:hypothetical protein
MPPPDTGLYQAIHVGLVSWQQLAVPAPSPPWPDLLIGVRSGSAEFHHYGVRNRSVGLNHPNIAQIYGI